MKEVLQTPTDFDWPSLQKSRRIPEVIGLAGAARSGKDTTAQIITRLYGHKQVAFASKLKELLFEVNPYLIHPAQEEQHRVQGVLKFLGPEVSKDIPEYRRLLQVTGMAVRGILGEETWINAALKAVEPPIVVSDVRIKNEAEKIWRMGGVLIQVQRPGVAPLNEHISEHDLNDITFDAVIHNSGDLHDLDLEVTRVLEGLA